MCVGAVAACSSPEPETSVAHRGPWDEKSPLGIPLSAPLVGPEPGETKVINLPSGRQFRLHVPKDYDPEKKWPVVLLFHGWKESAEKIQNYSQMDAAEAILAYPLGKDAAWSPAPYAVTTAEEDLDFVEKIIDGLRATYTVDDSRIYAAGLSNGGGFAAFLACRMPETFRSVATVSAAYYDGIHEGCAQAPVGRLDIHGTDDPVVSYYGGKRHGVHYSSVPEVLNEHQKRNNCSGPIHTVRLTNNALQETWLGCDAPLQHIRIGGGSHVWPGGRSDDAKAAGAGFATDKVLDFFGIPGRPAGTVEQGEVEEKPAPTLK
ncbi:PHB depolymerase family esterase [Corynebacterium sp.]|uniref:alpha/beta hydrolase family esterase n=1 Tax=Corynebacterium sp. TaxID=1720 RepID=UPI0026DAFBA6|nr:PHB depolymerase family esterase [Corynebacterium sp.]MDO5031628.1 PHB depolymerase family esterase [Corynebacterium sp.]